jgi:hypothetical protein
VAAAKHWNKQTVYANMVFQKKLGSRHSKQYSEHIQVAKIHSVSHMLKGND